MVKILVDFFRLEAFVGGVVGWEGEHRSTRLRNSHSNTSWARKR